MKFNTLIRASVGKTKSELTSVDVNATVSDVVGVLGNFIEFRVSKEDDKVKNTDVEKQKNSFSILMLASKDKTKLPDKWNESSARNKLK